MNLKGSKGVIWESLEGGKGRRNDVIIISRNKNKLKKRSGSG